MIAIRPYKADDLDEVVDVFQRSVREVACQHYSLEQIAVWAPDPPDRGAWGVRLAGDGVFVAVQGQEIAGFTRVDDRGHIDLMFVHPAFQRCGVASSLFDVVVRWVSERGISSLSADASMTARPFFERAGFSVVRPQEVERQGVRLQNFVMRRCL